MRALLIEERRPALAALKRGLEEQGYDLDVVHDVTEGDRKARTIDYQAIILNLGLANGDASAVLMKWRRAGVGAAVLVLTPGDRIADGVRSLELGAGDFLTIPFEPAELFARLRALVRRGQQSQTTTYKAHDLEIDPNARIVKRRGQRIRLTPREFSLLEFLARHRGRVVSRSMIWRSLYDEHDRNTSNVVDVYIGYLRNKIDRGYETPLILTRWGEGYLLRGDDA